MSLHHLKLIIGAMLVQFVAAQWPSPPVRSPTSCPASQEFNNNYNYPNPNVNCPSGYAIISSAFCDEVNCNAYNCNGYNCNCRDCNCKWYCFGGCCDTCCDTCYQTCYQRCAKVCYSCRQCVNTAAPTKRPTRFPTNHPTKLPTKNPTKAPIPTPNPTNFPSKAPTQYPTNFPTLNPTFAPTKSPTVSPIPPTTPDPTAAPVPTPEPTPPTFNPTFLPTQSPTESSIFDLENLIIFGGIICAGLAASVAGFFLIYRRRSGPGTDDDLTAAEELLSWKAKNGNTPANDTIGLSNPMYGQEVKEYGTPVVRPDLSKQRQSLKGLNVHAWLQEAKEEQTRRESVKEPEEPIKMQMRWDFESQDEDELSAKKGTVLYCIDKKGDWFVASNPLTGESGIVPADYVMQYLDDDDI